MKVPLLKTTHIVADRKRCGSLIFSVWACRRLCFQKPFTFRQSAGADNVTEKLVLQHARQAGSVWHFNIIKFNFSEISYNKFLL